MPESRVRKTPAKKTAVRRAPGSTAKRTSASRPSSVEDFKSRRQKDPDRMLLTLPSGLGVEADRSGVASAFLKTGLIPNPLMEKIQQHLDDGSELSPEEAMEMAKDPEQVELLTRMMMEVVVAVCVEPEVHSAPVGKARRRKDWLYVDELDDMDQMFIYQWATGGTSDLASFRRESGRDLADLLRG